MKHYLFIPTFLLYALGALILFFVVMPAQAQNPKLADSVESQPEEDLVHFGDVIDVDVIGVFDYDWRGTLTPEGFLAGLDSFSEPVFGLCRTEAEIAAAVAKIYGKILRNPIVVVKIIDRSNRAVVRLDGGVRTPTRFRLRRAVHLRELLVLAGGLTDEVSSDISIFRPGNLSCRSDITAGPISAGRKSVLLQDNGSRSINIKIIELLSGNAAADPEILSGDMITVSKASPVYVIGAVNNPRPVYVRSEITVERAIATAGGFAKESDGQKVSIFRRDGTDTRVIDVDLGKIKRGELKDEVLKPFDIIEAVAKGSGKRRYPPVGVGTEVKDRAITSMPLRVVE